MWVWLLFGVLYSFLVVAFFRFRSLSQFERKKKKKIFLTVQQFSFFFFFVGHINLYRNTYIYTCTFRENQCKVSNEWWKVLIKLRVQHQIFKCFLFSNIFQSFFLSPSRFRYRSLSVALTPLFWFCFVFLHLFGFFMRDICSRKTQPNDNKIKIICIFPNQS